MDPITISMLAGGAVKGLAGLFSDSEEEKRNKQRRRLVSILRAQQQRNKEQAGTDKLQSERDYAGEKTDRRNMLNQKQAQYGYDAVGSIGSNEEDIVNANLQNKAGIDARLAELNNQIETNIGGTEADMEDPESDISRFLGNSIQGANIGKDFGQALGFLDPKKLPMGGLGGGGEVTNYSDKVSTPVTNPPAVDNPLMNMNMDMGLGMGNNGDLSAFNTGNLMDFNVTGTPNYADMMDKFSNTGSINLTGGKMPFKKLNSVYRLRK